MIKKRMLLAIVAFTTLTGFSLGIEPVAAAIHLDSFSLRDDGDTGWRVAFDPEFVIAPQFRGTPQENRDKDGDLTIGLIRFQDLNPIEITFVQERGFVQGQNEVAGLNFGLRITLAFDIRNNSGIDWRGFELKLSDDNRELEFDSGEPLHPGFAHFHNLPADRPQAFPPFTLLTPANPNFDGEMGRGDRYLLGRDRFKETEERSWTGIGIHQWEKRDQTRSFTLRLTPIPVPEPGTLPVFIFGILCLLGYSWRHRKRTPSTSGRA